MTDAPTGIKAPEYGGMSFNGYRIVELENREIGWLFSLNPPGRYVFESPYPELRELERLAWSIEREALQEILAFVLVTVDPAQFKPTLPGIEARTGVMAVTARETMVVDGRELGCIFWNSLARKCVFEAKRHELLSLECIAWPDPSSASMHIIAFDHSRGRDTAGDLYL